METGGYVDCVKKRVAMKTKEIDVWVGYNEKPEDGAIFPDSETCERHGWDKSIEAKLIIEIPERKIEVTESMILEACEQTGQDGLVLTFHLFGSNEDE